MANSCKLEVISYCWHVSIILYLVYIQEHISNIILFHCIPDTRKQKTHICHSSSKHIPPCIFGSGLAYLLLHNQDLSTWECIIQLQSEYVLDYTWYNLLSSDFCNLESSVLIDSKQECKNYLNPECICFYISHRGSRLSSSPCSFCHHLSSMACGFYHHLLVGKFMVEKSLGNWNLLFLWTDPEHIAQTLDW